MTALDEARLHLAKARELIDAAEASRDLGLANAAGLQRSDLSDQ